MRGLDRRRCLTGGLAGGLAAAATAGRANAGQDDDTARLAFDRYRRLINLHDFDLLAGQVIAPDAVFVFSDRLERGLDAVRASFLRTWAILPDEIYAMSDPEWLLDGRDGAACAFRYAYAGTMTSGRRLTGGGRGVILLRPGGRGWRVVYEHLTPAPAAAPD